MTNFLQGPLFPVVASLLFVSACFPDANVDVHDNTANTVITPATVSVVAEEGEDTSNVHPGQDVNIVVTATNVFLVDPDTTPPADHAEDAGHLRFYLDDMDGAPILITHQLNVSIPISLVVLPGNHTVYCRVHKHDRTPTSAVSELNITVTLGGG